MLKHLTLMSFMFLSLSAFADLNGTYQGAVTYTDYNGQSSNADLDLSITVTANSVTITEATGWILLSNLDVANGKVSYQGTEVGTITDTMLDVKDYMGNQGVAYSLNLTLNGNNLTVKDMAVTGGKQDGLDGTIAKTADSSRSYPVRIHPRFLVD